MLSRERSAREARAAPTFGASGRPDLDAAPACGRSYSPPGKQVKHTEATGPQMTRETTTSLPPERVLEEAKQFFTSDLSVYTASVEEESESHVAFSGFRSRFAVSAFPDPRGQAPTRVRVSTLRVDEAIGKFLTHIRTLSPDVDEPASSTR